jgi:hypothetical protein
VKNTDKKRVVSQEAKTLALVAGGSWPESWGK